LVEYALRPARETDVSSIRRLVHLGGINPTGLDWRRFIVAEMPSGGVVGCGQVKPHSGEVLELASIAVHPDHRRSGIATAIIRRLLAGTPRPLFLMCRSTLGRFYEEFGFRSIGADDMPLYFRRISRVAGLVESLARTGESLLVMKLQ
jgi:N-acetylglutamate synthase-like GNAT family acetyltransferase